MDVLSKWLLGKSQNAYDFLAAPILGAAVAFAVEYFNDLGLCLNSIFGQHSAFCLVPNLFRLISVITMTLAGILLWRLGYHAKIIKERIADNKILIEEKYKGCHPIEVIPRIEESENDIRKAKSGKVLLLAFFIILCILCSGIASLYEGIFL